MLCAKYTGTMVHVAYISIIMCMCDNIVTSQFRLQKKYHLLTIRTY